MHRIVLTLAATVAPALALTACSSPGATSSGGAPTRAATHAGATAPSSRAADPSGAPVSSGGDFCARFTTAGNELIALGGGNPTTIDPATYQQKLNQLVSAAPSAIRLDLQAIGAIEVQVVKGDVGADAQLAQPAALAHVRHFVSWMQANCPGTLDVPSGLPTS